MSRTRGTMQEIANPGSEFTWATYAFAGNDPLEAALAPGYFAQWASRLQPGDLILWGCNPDRTGRSNLGEPVDIRRALLMVTMAQADRCEVRLLQDWGGPEAEPTRATAAVPTASLERAGAKVAAAPRGR